MSCTSRPSRQPEAGAVDATGAVGRSVGGTDARLARVVAATLAAAAESGIVFLPVMELTREGVGATAGPLISFGLFFALFVAGVAIGSALQRFRLYTWFVALAALGSGLAEGLAWGSRDAPGTVFVVVLALLVALRVVTLAVRDWRDPVRGSFGWGAAAVLLEVAFQGGAAPAWSSLLPVVVALFFTGSLASRGVSVLAVDRVGER